jgi:hypothetical protein
VATGSGTSGESFVEQHSHSNHAVCHTYAIDLPLEKFLQSDKDVNQISDYMVRAELKQPGKKK